MAGKIVESRDASNRFLADLRKTVGDCMADNHYAVLAELAARHGLFIHCEAGGPHAGTVRRAEEPGPMRCADGRVLGRIRPTAPLMHSAFS